MTYDPFSRGPLDVGERTLEVSRGARVLPLEVWYPADSHGTRWPLVVFSHTSAGHRRQSTFLTTHLASHGYLVGAVEHMGNTAADYAARTAQGITFTDAQRQAYIDQIIADRVPDLRCALDALLTGDFGSRLDPQRIGAVGWSFGGWAALATPEIDDRVGAVVALAPGGSSNPLPGIIPARLTFTWHRKLPTLLLVAEQDQYTPLDGQLDIFERAPLPKDMFVLRGADHMHFGDVIDQEGACPTAAAHAFTRSLTLAHLDANLRGNDSGVKFLSDSPIAALEAHGVNAYRVDQAPPALPGAATS